MVSDALVHVRFIRVVRENRPHTLKRRFRFPKSGLRPPIAGSLVRSERQKGSGRGPHAKPMLLNRRTNMRHVDFSPLYRSTVGFDRLFTMLDSMAQPENGGQTYP